MTANDPKKCEHCGATIPATSTETLCPACLLSGVLDPHGVATETITMAPAGPLSMHGPSEFPCQFGDYRLLGLLGRGGMGTVYEAEQVSTGRRVALKMLGYQIDSMEMRQRFLREGRLAARVNHPNSLYIFGSEEIDDHPVITMEIAGSGTLKDILRQRGPLPVAEAVDAILNVIDGLDAASRQDVLHRDIKPSNCFVSPDGSVKVGDFGLSVSTLAKTDTFVTHGKIMGTPAYASPEQLRGDALDVRADIYSVGATLYTLLSDRAPFEGDNAVQVVANAVNQPPKPLTEYRTDIPQGLLRIINRCLAKEPDGRYATYTQLRDALMPFSSQHPKPASMIQRVSTGWVDYLTAFLIPYVVIMLFVGAKELFVNPLVERTLYSFRYYFLFWAVGFLYFTIAEGIFGAGLGKRLKGLRVVRTNGKVPGMVRAFVRIFIPIFCVEAVRMPISMSFIHEPEWTGFQAAMFILLANLCPWISVGLTFFARKENGYATLWDKVTGTRVVFKPKGTSRPCLRGLREEKVPGNEAKAYGPYLAIDEIDPGNWVSAFDPVLRRQVWLLRQSADDLSTARRNIARPGRLRWLQKVRVDGITWNVFEAPDGMPLSDMITNERKYSWSSLRYWLNDISTELWDAAGDHTLPEKISIDQIWLTDDGRAVLLDQPWPQIEAPAEFVDVQDIAGQQRFLNAITACCEPTTLPLHARPVLENLREGRFEKLSFLTGTLRGLIERPADVTRGVRAGSMFMLFGYTWILCFVGYYHDKQWLDALAMNLMVSITIVLGIFAVAQLFELPFRCTSGQSIFRLAVINHAGKLASVPQQFIRWCIIWLPLALPMVAIIMVGRGGDQTLPLIIALILLLAWIGAGLYAVLHPHRGLHDRLSRTWVVRR